MEKLQFSTGEILGQAWQIFKQRWSQLLGIGVLYMVLSSIATSLPALFQSEDSQVATLGASLIAQILSLFLSIGMTKIVLAVVRQQEINIADMFVGGKYFLDCFFGSLVVTIITFFGYLLLVIPGIIWSLKYMFVFYLIVDENMDFSKAMKESEQMTNGIKWQLLGFGAAMVGINLLGMIPLFLINLLGMIPLFLGLLITIPVTSLASFVLYDVLRKQYIAAITGEVAQPIVVGSTVETPAQVAAPSSVQPQIEAPTPVQPTDGQPGV